MRLGLAGERDHAFVRRKPLSAEDRPGRRLVSPDRHVDAPSRTGRHEPLHDRHPRRRGAHGRRARAILQGRDEDFRRPSGRFVHQEDGPSFPQTVTRGFERLQRDLAADDAGDRSLSDEERGGRSDVRDFAADRASQVEHELVDRAMPRFVDRFSERVGGRRSERRDFHDGEVLFPLRLDRRRSEPLAAQPHRHLLVFDDTEETDLDGRPLGSFQGRRDLPERRVAEVLSVHRVNQVSRLNLLLFRGRARQRRDDVGETAPAGDDDSRTDRA